MPRFLEVRRSSLVAAATGFVLAACAATPSGERGQGGDRALGPHDAGATVATHALDATRAIDAAVAEVAIVDWPIAWSDERERLMLAYRRRHSDPAAVDLTIAPTVIVLHYTAGGSAKATKRYFDRTLLERGRARLRDGGAVNVSAHFLVDRDGTIYRLQPETRMARHCIGLNHVAVGVESVGDEDRYRLTEAQVEANARLVRHLASRFRITHLVGHHEARDLEGTPLFVERDRGYRNTKPDPGARFMTAVRARVADLELAGAP